MRLVGEGTEMMFMMLCYGYSYIFSTCMTFDALCVYLFCVFHGLFSLFFASLFIHLFSVWVFKCVDSFCFTVCCENLYKKLVCVNL